VERDEDTQRARSKRSSSLKPERRWILAKLAINTCHPRAPFIPPPPEIWCGVVKKGPLDITLIFRRLTQLRSCLNPLPSNLSLRQLNSSSDNIQRSSISHQASPDVSGLHSVYAFRVFPLDCCTGHFHVFHRCTVTSSVRYLFNQPKRNNTQVSSPTSNTHRKLNENPHSFQGQENPTFRTFHHASPYRPLR
jgi:hypothetical protein